MRSRTIAWYILSALPLLGAGMAYGAGDMHQGLCQGKEAREHYLKGFQQQQQGLTDQALPHYKKCIEQEPKCVSCQYEIGWSYWKLAAWDKVVYHWQNVLELAPKHTNVLQYLPTAKQNLLVVNGEGRSMDFKRGVPLLTTSKPANSTVRIVASGRIQSYNRKPKHPLDHYERQMDSPKSVNFHPNGKKVYVNALEAARTLVYALDKGRKLAEVDHSFGQEQAGLFTKSLAFGWNFEGQNHPPREFSGKPVEGTFSKGGKLFFAPYYRRSFDADARYPSALGVIDTVTDRIVRVLPTGPIPKYVRLSHKGDQLAVSNWGDNTITLYNVDEAQPENMLPQRLLVVGKQMPREDMHGNRDRNCGYCVRGLAYSQEDRYLFASRMKKGGIALFDLMKEGQAAYLGTLFGVCPGPRDLHLGPNGAHLYATCNATGYVARVAVKKVVSLLSLAKDKAVRFKHQDPAVQKVFIGMGARSMAFSPDGRYVFAVSNLASEVVAIATEDLEIVSRIDVDSYPVGLGLSPDGSTLWTTSQGRDGKGGDSVSMFTVRYLDREAVSQHATSTPSKAP